MKFNWEKPEIVEIAERRYDFSNTKKKKEKYLILKHKTKKTAYEVEDNLFLKFATTKLNDEEILKLANKYGLLGLGGHEEIDHLNTETLEPLFAWYRELATIKSVIKNLYHYQKKNFRYLNRYFKFWKDTGLWEFYDDTYRCNNKKIKIGYIGEEPPDHWNKSSSINENNADHLMKDYLFYVLLDSYSPRVGVEFDKKSEWIKTKIKPHGLIGEIWRQINEFIENKNLLRNCKYCKKLFVIGKKNARLDKDFCSQNCTVQNNRTQSILKKAETTFNQRNLVVIPSGKPIPGTFDFLVLHQGKPIAGLEISQSDISRESQKWENKEKKIIHKMKSKNFTVAFLVNKNGTIYIWDLKNKIEGKEFSGDRQILSKESSEFLTEKFYADGLKEKISGLPVEDIELTKGEIRDIDRVFAQGDKISLVDIDRLIFQYRGSIYLQEKLKHDPAMLKLFPDGGGLNMDASFEEARLKAQDYEIPQFLQKQTNFEDNNKLTPKLLLELEDEEFDDIKIA